MTIRRRRECTACGKRFTTYEVVEKLPLMVIKHDGRREVFKRDKILNGIIRSCDIGRLVMERLKDFDDVAYIRFASVYRKFADISSFLEELQDMQARKQREQKKQKGENPPQAQAKQDKEAEKKKSEKD